MNLLLFLICTHLLYLGTTWSELNDEKVPLNLDELDKMFEQKDDGKEEKASTASGEKPKEEKPKEISLIPDANRLRNVTIALSRLRISHDDLKTAILAFDETILHSEMVLTLINMVPIPEEIEILTV